MTEKEITDYLIWDGKQPNIAFFKGPKPIKEVVNMDTCFNCDPSHRGSCEKALPGSWLDDNLIRHAVVWDLDQEVRYKLVNGKIQLIEESFF